jgi:hypothetical protein
LARGRRFRAASSARFLQEGHLRRKPGGSVRQRGATSGVTRRGLDSGAPRACFGANAAPRACPTSRQRGAPRALRSAGARAARRRAECQFASSIASSRLPPALPPASSAASSAGVPPGGNRRRKRPEIAGHSNPVGWGKLFGRGAPKVPIRKCRPVFLQVARARRTAPFGGQARHKRLPICILRRTRSFSVPYGLGARKDGCQLSLLLTPCAAQLRARRPARAQRGV